VAFFCPNLILEDHLILLTSIKIRWINCKRVFYNYGRPETFI